MTILTAHPDKCASKWDKYKDQRAENTLFSALCVLNSSMNLHFYFLMLPFLAMTAQAQTKIGVVQGTGARSPLVGKTVEIGGIVTADFQQADQLGGFFIQDGGDGDEATSDGIFVYAPLSRANAVDVGKGAQVRVSGLVEEFNGQTQIGRPQVQTLVGDRVKQPEPLTLTWPLPEGVSAERYESMLVTLPQPLTVTGLYQLTSYGTLMLAAEGRLFVPGSRGGSKAELRLQEQTNARRTILLDDGSSKRSPKPVPFLNALGTRRSGDIVTNLTGILSEAFEAYRIQPTVEPQFMDANPRPALPAVGGSLKVVSFNLHNYFTTLKRTGNDARGAESGPQLARQSAKLLAAVRAMEPDILACIEVENNGEKTVLDFLNKLNAVTNNAYASVGEPQTGIGADEIRVALLYRKDKVTPRGGPKSDTTPIFDRPPLAQTFASPKGALFTIVVNHFKSKGSCPENGDIDEGEGCWNQRRTAQSMQLLKFIAQLKQESGSPHILAIGDFNAYTNEAPLRALREGGLQSPLQSATDYSFSYDGRFGSLDHAFVTKEMVSIVKGVAPWHINADEPTFLDYSESRVAPAEADFYRSSDHDPLLVGLEF